MSPSIGVRTVLLLFLQIIFLLFGKANFCMAKVPLVSLKKSLYAFQACAGVLGPILGPIPLTFLFLSFLFFFFLFEVRNSHPTSDQRSGTTVVGEMGTQSIFLCPQHRRTGVAEDCGCRKWSCEGPRWADEHRAPF